MAGYYERVWTSEVMRGFAGRPSGSQSGGERPRAGGAPGTSEARIERTSAGDRDAWPRAALPEVGRATDVRGYTFGYSRQALRKPIPVTH